jgi:hypothetical protein
MLSCANEPFAQKQESEHSEDAGLKIIRQTDIDEVNRKIVLTRLLKFRCGRLFTKKEHAQECANEVDPFVKMLHYGLRKSKEDSGIALFQDELIELAVNGKGLKFLDSLENEWQNFVKNPESFRFSLWDFAFRYTGSDRVEATRYIGILLQDGAVSKQASFLMIEAERRGNDKDQLIKMATKIYELTNTIEQSLHTSQKVFDNFSWYPSDISNVNENYYHFYIPTYAAQKMRKANKSALTSFVLPFLFNFEYEYLQLTEADSKKKLEKRKLPAFLSWTEPLFGPVGKLLYAVNPPPYKPIDRSAFESNLKDMYLGYAGAVVAAGLKPKVTSYEEFARSLAKDPEGYLKVLFSY